MFRFLGRITLLTIVLALSGVSAQAQYHYPGGYGDWGGWGGGGTSAGGFARGAGIYAAGAGAYNEQTAMARSINADTYMQMNSYLGACNENCVKSHCALLAKNNNNQEVTAEATFDRLFGDALQPLRTPPRSAYGSRAGASPTRPALIDGRMCDSRDNLRTLI